MLTLWIATLLLGGVLAWFAGRYSDAAPRWISVGVLLLDLALVLPLLWGADVDVVDGGSAWLAQELYPWIPRFGISFHLAVDGLSLVLILLTLAMGLMAVGASWREIDKRVGFFHFNLLWTLAGVLGVFLALDLFLFFFFWEVMLVPMYFLIGIWGHENRVYAAIKFFIFTQASGLLMLAAILGLVFAHQGHSGDYSFGYFDLLETPVGSLAAGWIMLGFFVAFAVKLPAFPFHPWLPDAHTEAPTGGSVILAAILLKTGAYGLIRFAVPLLPDAAAAFAPAAMALGAISVVYGAVLAFAQDDIKRLIACSSISHMGFVLLAIFAWNELALQGATMQMLAHGVSTGALFMLAGALQERLHTRDMGRMGGLWATAPRLAAIGVFFAIASLGMPGLGNFVGEFLILFGAFQVNVLWTVVAAAGLVGAVVYSLIMVQRSFHGPNEREIEMADFGGRELAMMLVLIAAIVWLGVYPQPVFDLTEPAIVTMQQYAGS